MAGKYGEEDISSPFLDTRNASPRVHDLTLRTESGATVRQKGGEVVHLKRRGVRKARVDTSPPSFEPKVYERYISLLANRRWLREAGLVGAPKSQRRGFALPVHGTRHQTAPANLLIP